MLIEQNKIITFVVLTLNENNLKINLLYKSWVQTLLGTSSIKLSISGWKKWPGKRRGILYQKLYKRKTSVIYKKQLQITVHNVKVIAGRLWWILENNLNYNTYILTPYLESGEQPNLTARNSVVFKILSKVKNLKSAIGHLTEAVYI